MGLAEPLCGSLTKARPALGTLHHRSVTLRGFQHTQKYMICVFLDDWGETISDLTYNSKNSNLAVCQGADAPRTPCSGGRAGGRDETSFYGACVLICLICWYLCCGSTGLQTHVWEPIGGVRYEHICKTCILVRRSLCVITIVETSVKNCIGWCSQSTHVSPQQI